LADQAEALVRLQPEADAVDRLHRPARRVVVDLQVADVENRPVHVPSPWIRRPIVPSPDAPYTAPRRNQGRGQMSRRLSRRAMLIAAAASAGAATIAACGGGLPTAVPTRAPEAAKPAAEAQTAKPSG